VTSQSLQPILALMGYPVGGNPIQYMTEKAFARHGLDWRYVSLEIHPDDLADAVRGMKVMGFLGGNVADPHKEAIGPLLDALGPTAERTGLVNLVRRDENRLVGENTEGKALVDLLRARLELAGRQVVLLGAGHVARAIAVELADAGVAEITVVDRTEQRAIELAEILAGKFEAAASAVPWLEDYSVPSETDLLIHATSAAQGDPDLRLALNLENLESRATVVDTTIDPPDTWLLHQARQSGCTTLDGVTIFTNQIFLNCQMWTGVEPDRDLLREAIEEFLEL
jgi:shikimate dehydrogenase